MMVRNVLRISFDRHFRVRPGRSQVAKSTMLKTLILLSTLFAIPALAQKDLPDGTGKVVAVRLCTGCHGAEMFSAIRLNQVEWERKVANMTSERGVEISDADFAAVLKYLVTYLGPPKPGDGKAPAAK